MTQEALQGLVEEFMTREAPTPVKLTAAWMKISK
jgi:hypothetical protein